MFLYDVEALAQESFIIAWDYLERAGAIEVDTVDAMIEIGNEIVAFLSKGENHKIRIANLAIDAYCRRHRAEAA